MHEVKYLTTTEVAAILSAKNDEPISPRQVQREIKNGYLQGEKFGNTYMIKPSALNHYERRPRGAKKGSKRSDK